MATWRPNTKDLTSLVESWLRSDFPTTPFHVEAVSDTEFGVLWDYSLPNSPSESEIEAAIEARLPGVLTLNLRDTGDDHEDLSEHFRPSKVLVPVRGNRGRTNMGEGLPDMPDDGIPNGITRKPHTKAPERTCVHCAAGMKGAQRHCTICGTAAPACARCNAVLLPRWEYCGKCGLSVDLPWYPPPPPGKRKSHRVLGLLGFVLGVVFVLVMFKACV